MPTEGVLQALFASPDNAHSRRLIHESIAAATNLRLRQLQSGHHYRIALLANNFARLGLRQQFLGAEQLWSDHGNLSLAPALRYLLPQYDAAADDGSSATLRRPNIWLYKLSALLLSPFERTLYLDSDIHVLQSGLVEYVLTDVLRSVDFTAPISHNGWGLGAYGPSSKKLLSNTSSPYPLTCACMIGFVRTDATRHVFENAAASLINKTHPRLARQTDQEYLWFQLRSLYARGRARALSLEYYCPPQARPRLKHAPDDPRNLTAAYIFAPGGTKLAPGPSIACWALHGHHLSSDTDELAARVQQHIHNRRGNTNRTSGGGQSAETRSKIRRGAATGPSHVPPKRNEYPIATPQTAADNAKRQAAKAESIEAQQKRKATLKAREEERIAQAEEQASHRKLGDRIARGEYTVGGRSAGRPPSTF